MMSEKPATYNVHAFPTETGRTPQQTLLEALETANKGDLKEVLVVGVDAEEFIRIWSSDISRKDALWLAECAKRHALEGCDEH